MAGFVVLPEHRSEFVQTCPHNANFCGSLVAVHVGLSRALYDTLRITTWALAIIGALLVAMGLIGYAQPGVER